MGTPLKKMRENSPGLRFLKELFETGEINGTESPKDVRDRFPTLQQYDSKTFGDKYRKYKPSPGSASVRPRNTEGPIQVSEPSGSGSELLMDQWEFHPNYYIAQWIDPDAGMAERLTAVIALPSGVPGEDVKVALRDNGTILEIEAPWPSPLQDPTGLCTPFIQDATLPNYTSFHPEVIALEKAMKELKMDAGNNRSEILKSKARIRLPVQVIVSKLESYVFTFHPDGESSSKANTLHVRFFVAENEYDVDIGRPGLVDIRPSPA